MKLRKDANERGIPYQTLLNNLFIEALQHREKETQEKEDRFENKVRHIIEQVLAEHKLKTS